MMSEPGLYRAGRDTAAGEARPEEESKRQKEDWRSVRMSGQEKW